MNEQYRTDQYGKVYEYSADDHAYIFCGCLNGRTLAQFIKDQEEAELWPGMEA